LVKKLGNEEHMGGTARLRTEVKHVENEANLQCIYQIEQQEYGVGTILSFESVLSWWKRYPHGAYQLQQDWNIIGGMGIWPLSETAFQDLAQGRLEERGITAEHVIEARNPAPLTCWYIADVILADKYRRTKDHLAIVLLEGALRTWLSNENLAARIKLCALAYSEQGRSLLKRMGFDNCAKSPDGHEVYVRVTAVQEFQKDVEALSMLLHKRP
jgi:hypothetical protein